MAYNKINYAQFKDIKTKTFSGYNIVEVTDEFADFLSDPAHGNYRFLYVNSNTESLTKNPSFNYFPGEKGRIPQDMWSSIQLYYVEE